MIPNFIKINTIKKEYFIDTINNKLTNPSNTTSSMSPNTTSSMSPNTTSSMSPNTTSSMIPNTTSSMIPNTTSSMIQIQHQVWFQIWIK